MDFVLVFPLLLSFLSTGQSHTEQMSNSCYEECPPGYHKDKDCGGSDKKSTCKICGNGTYTEINNILPKCQRCKTCGHYEVEIKPCSFDRNVVCNCKKNYFYKIKADAESSQKDSSLCRECICNCEDLDDYPDYKKMCTSCKSRKCTAAAPITSSTNSSTAAPTSASASTRTTNNTSSPVVDPLQPPPGIEIPWFILVVVLVLLLVTVLVFLLLFASNPFRHPASCCWSVNKNLEPPVEDPKFNEQSGHQGGGPNTLTFNISEETPMMTLSPATPEHPLLPDAEHKAARQEEPSEHWPAIVLYAIIKEVPLRRWKEFLRLLSVADQQLERVELEAGLGLGSMERQYQMLRLWSQRSSAGLNDVFSALHYMDLSGCAQLLQESLEKLQ